MKKYIVLLILVTILNGCQKNNTNHTKLESFFNDSQKQIPLINSVLWEENESLTAKSFYEKYIVNFNNYGIHLKFNSDESITTEDGKNYPLINYPSNFEKYLMITSRDYVKVKIAIEAYEKIIKPILVNNEELRNDFEWVIYKYFDFIGAENNDQLVNIIKKYQSLNLFYNQHQYEFNQFLNEIKSKYPKIDKNKNTTIKKVAILTGPYGGGHISAANVLSESLNKKVDVIKINECTDKDLNDTLYILTNSSNKKGFHDCNSFYNFAVAESDYTKFTLFHILSTKLASYIPHNRYHKMYEKIKNENVDVIISTLHHIEQMSSFSYLLDIPTKIVVTDFSFPEKQWWQLNHQDSNLIKYWVPDLGYKGFFRELVKFVSNPFQKRWDFDYEGSHINKIKNEIIKLESDEDRKDRLEKMGVFEHIPFPLFKTSSQNSKESLSENTSQKLALTKDPNRKIITLAIGGVANPEKLSSTLEQIIRVSSKIKYNIQLIILTSGNELVAQSAQKIFNKHKIPFEQNENLLNGIRNENLIAKILPRLDSKTEMPLIYKASNIFISKPGGATTAELIQTKTPFIRGFGLWTWEIENAKYLEYLKLSYNKDTSSTNDFLNEDLESYLFNLSDVKLIDQINYHLSRNREELVVKDTIEFNDDLVYKALNLE